MSFLCVFLCSFICAICVSFLCVPCVVHFLFTAVSGATICLHCKTITKPMFVHFLFTFCSRFLFTFCSRFVHAFLVYFSVFVGFLCFLNIFFYIKTTTNACLVDNLFGLLLPPPRSALLATHARRCNVPPRWTNCNTPGHTRNPTAPRLAVLRINTKHCLDMFYWFW